MKHAIVAVELHDLVIDVPDLYHLVDMVRWWCPIVIIPDKLGWIEQGGHRELIFGMWVVSVVGVNNLLHVGEVSHHSVLGTSFYQVIESSTADDPHGADLMVVV